jgi:Family of unknown function (DUF6114)
MARWHEARQDHRYGQAHAGERYQQQPGWLEVLLGADMAGATASPAGEDPGHQRSGAYSSGRADFEADPATAAMEPVGAGDQGPWHQRARTAFRQWRRTRPFWGGLLCLLGGTLMAYGPLSVFRYVLVAGTVIWAGVLIGLLVCAMGLFLWLAPQFRQIVGILAAVFSVVSLITSNLGGFLIGLLLGAFGGALGFAWTPVSAAGGTAMTMPGTPAQSDQDEAGQHEAGQHEEAGHGAGQECTPVSDGDGVARPGQARLPRMSQVADW